jgi:hypothetical protein
MNGVKRFDLLNQARSLDVAGPVEKAFVEARKSVSAPSHLCHYTTDAGLYGILRSKKMRISDVFTLNDPSEIQYGFDTFFDQAASYRGDAKDAVEFSDFVVSVQSLIKRTVAAPVPDSIDYFCASFSSYHDDDLSQWRSYGDNGRGYCLLFDGKKLEEAFLAFGERRSNQVFAISYGTKHLTDVFNEILQKVYSIWSEFRAELATGGGGDAALWRTLRNIIAVSLHRSIIYFAQFIKHKAYEPEEEYRFSKVIKARDPVGDCTTELRGHRLARYYSFDWTLRGKDALRKIIVGPAAVPYAEKFVRDCLDQFDYSNIDVEVSKIPYRVF